MRAVENSKMANLAQDTSKSAKSLAQQIAKQMAQEPLEIFDDVKEQIGIESAGQPGGERPRQPDNLDQQQNIHQQNTLQDKMRSERRMEALIREIEDIRKQDIFKDLQRRISEGEVVPLEEYPDLSLDQRQVLNAQMEAVKNQMAQSRNNVVDVPSIHSKPSRRFGAGQKSQAEKEQTHVEKPVPPSG